MSVNIYSKDFICILQVTYPAKVSSSDEDNDRLLDILARVGLLNLYNRIGGFDVPVEWTWSDVLTPGEMQCLSFARLFYARPKFVSKYSPLAVSPQESVVL